jgi:hypothetical protein
MTYKKSEEIAVHGDEISHVEPDDIGVGMLTVVGALCAVVLLLIVVLLQAWFYNWKDALIAQRSGPIDAQAAPAAIAAEQLKKIESYGVRKVPIQRAMELIVQEYGETPDATTNKEKTH